MNRTRHYIGTLLMLLMLGGMMSETWAQSTIPTGLTVTKKSIAAATLSWTEVGSATKWQVCFVDDKENLISADTNPFTLTGLSPNTTYKVKVRAIISEDPASYSDWSSQVQFTTASQVEVTYHVITLPFGEEHTTGANRYRIEAIKKKVSYTSPTTKIDLPQQLKSPLLKSDAYSYYIKPNVVINSQTKIFLNNGSRYDTFDFDDNNDGVDDKTPLSASATVADIGCETDIYVTYLWNEGTKSDYGKELALDGSKTYNIELSTGSGSWLYALNLDESRANRLQAIPASDIYDEADLASDGIVKIKKDNVPYNNEERRNYNFTWKLVNNDPYNIILETAYTGNYIYYEPVDNKKLYKRTDGARYYTRLKSSTQLDNNPWLSNEWRYVWTSQTKEGVDDGRIDRAGWFRNEASNMSAFGVTGNIIPTANVVPNNVIFSFSLLNHQLGGSHTLVASWVNVNGNDWVPGTVQSNKDQYLHMMHTPDKYPGPAFTSFSNADQVHLHEVRDYTFKVKTPLSKTVLEVPMKWSDYAKETPLINRVPLALKRKYTEIIGTYKEEGLTTDRSTFEDIFDNDEPLVKKNRDIWLKYKVSESIPFEASGTTASFGDLKWYNIYVNKEDKYTVWYDKTESNKFSTVEGETGHTKYGHESHFAFIGDPYELYVVSRQASEDDSNTFHYMKLGTTKTNPLTTGIFNAFNAVTSGTTLTAGNTYYTSSTGGGKFIAVGTEKATGSNYFAKSFNRVTPGTTLTTGNTYYTSSSGGGMFKAGPTEVAGENQYYVEEFSAIPINKYLTAGNVYYTSSTGEGRFIAGGTERTQDTKINYYVKEYTKVTAGMKLTPGCVYYTSSKGDGPFIASYTGEADGSNYFEKSFSAVPNETTLTAGEIYYTLSGDGWFVANGSEKEGTTGTYYDEANVWEIVYDNDLGNYAGCFRLRKFYSYDNPVTIGWSTSSGMRPLDGDGSGNSSEARLTVLELPMMYYTYYIVDNDGRIAVMATEEQPIGMKLGYESIPENIRSPFLMSSDPNALWFKTYKSKLIYDNREDIAANYNYRTDLTPNLSDNIEYSNTEKEKEYKNHIFVFYDTSKLPVMTTHPLNDAPTVDHPLVEEFNVSLYGEYIYYDNGTIKSNNNLADHSIDKNYLWVLGGEDPYAMTIRNKGAEQYVKVASMFNGAELGWVTPIGNASRFIIKSGSGDNAYEVMAATGTTKDASITYYNIGRINNTTVRMYSNTTDEHENEHAYEHLNSEIRFVLVPSSAHDVYYHLIDRSNKELLIVKTRHGEGDTPHFPDEYSSPLVKKYYYFYESDFTYDLEKKTYKLTSPPNPLASTVTEIGDGGKDDETKHIYVIYDVDEDLVDMQHTTMYLIKFAQGEQYRQENGSDNLLTDAELADPNISKAVYPYCNGDGNFNIYGQYQYDVQQEGAASTRTRWAWYVQSSTHDPYHVMILSRQTETYKGLERSAYFATMQPEGYSDVITALVWPNISGVMATEYMMLGNVHQYRLMTTKPFGESTDTNEDHVIDVTEEKRYVVNKLEQYWKTYDLIRRNLLKDKTAANPADPADVPAEPSFVTGFSSNRTFLTTDTVNGGMGWHAYSKMAKAKRWNGYNKEGEASKGWESREHWFQTVKMGAGYFDLIPVEIAPALILLDQHGWEIMRKPLPTGPDDPNKEHKYDVLRRYDSPMVKEYFFWASAKKRSGYHQYYCLDKRIGGDFTSTSLTSLPPYDSENVKDNKGNQYDQYVTYTVKDEYAQSYQPGATPTAVPFLIRQGNKLAVKATSGTTIGKTFVDGTPGVAKYIMDKSSSTGLINELWYVKPNVNIDREMGYPATPPDWKSNPNAYEETTYSTLRTADLVVNTAAYQSLLTDDEKKAFITKYGYFSFSNGFDPYNIQISSQYGSQYFTMAMTGSYVEEGEIKGDYSGVGGSKNITQAAPNTSSVVGNSYDNSNFAMTNQTFMAVQDADGNMQLMPRFDHTLRVRDFRELVTTNVESADPDKLFETQTQLYRPFVYNYRIIDNEGREALRYKWAGDLVPQTPEHLKSPLANNFKYYSYAIYNDLTKKYSITESTDEETSPYEITAMSSMAGAGMSATGTNSNFVYVRYTYNEEADEDHILQGKWLTMELNGMDAQYDTGIENGTKPATSEDLKDAYKWHWKFLKNPYTAPDPYAVQLFNRSQTVTTEGVKVGLPMSANTIGASASASSSNAYQHFALLSHTDGSGNADGYALAVARTGLDTYPFLNGRSMSTTVGAKMEEDMDYSADQPESGFTSTSGTFHANDSRIVLTDDVTFDINYHIYTNGTNGINAVKYGVEAISEEQLYYEIAENEFVATLPENIRSPLLPQDWFLYYETIADMGDSNKEIKYLYGLYDNHVFVRYKLYDPGHTSYKVPNARNDVSAPQVARDPLTSNDSSLGLDGKLPYNIIWYDDNMMKSNDGNSTVGGDANQQLQHVGKYEWRFEGDDPYAIKIKSVGASADNAPKYINASNALTADAQTFMLLPKDGYEYGVLAVTGNRNSMLSLTNSSPALELTDIPQRFIIFTLATLRVVYHLVIANIKQADADGYETIAWRDPGTRGTTHTWLDNEMGYDTPYNESTNTKDIKGTSMRDLSNPNVRLGVSETYNSETLHYCYDVGRISLGDTLRVPDVFYRPNVVYSFFVRDICDGSTNPTLNTDMNNHYKGMEITSKRMGLDLDLIDKTIYINIVYSFNGNLDSNSGDNFVLGLNENKWYTLETIVDDKTYLAQYTNAWGFELKEGRGSHYTNDFLWSPIGDPYGFQLFNRYMDVNSGDHNLGEKDRVITTIPYETVITKTTDGEGKETITVSDTPVSAFKDGKQIVMGNYVTAGLRVVVPGGVTRTTTESTPGEGQVSLSSVKTNSIYELLSATTPGYFRIHPVANTPDSVFFHPENADDDRDGTNNFLVRLSATASEFTFNLTKELITPYFNRAGYVGGLKKSVYDELVTNNYPATTADGKENGYYNLAKVMLNADAVASAAQLRTAQTLVYDSANIVSLATGYYRLHSPLGISGIDPVRYASGYTHKTELNLTIPMHFYEKNSDEVRQFTDFKDGGFTSSPATQGDLTIPPVERDPASIFYFEKIAENEIPGTVPTSDKDRYNLATVGTQGLYVKGKKGQVTIEGGTGTGDNIEDDGERPAAIMTDNKSQATKLFVMDLGGGVLLIHDNVTQLGRRYLKYLSYDYSRDTEGNSTIYNLKLTNHTHTDHAKWCMQPVQSDVEKGVNEMGLRFTTSDYTLNNGGDGYYYTTFYAPYDVLLTDDKNDAAYICEVWDTEMLHLRKVGRYNNTENIPGLAKKYQGNNQFVPANTPVVIRTKNTSVTMALPKNKTNTPSPYKSENLKIVINGNVLKKDGVDVTVKNIFEGVCLEQILPYGSDYVYVFGLPFESPTKVTEDTGFDTNGKYTVEYPTSADTGVGFYINVNYNRETGGSAGEWIRNNKCVLSNKIYIRPSRPSELSSSRQETRSVDFIPVVFDDDDVEDEPIEDSMRQRPHDNRVYDMLGRCVATPQEVAEGTWRNKLAPGIYILNGRKIRR